MKLAVLWVRQFSADTLIGMSIQFGCKVQAGSSRLWQLNVNANFVLLLNIGWREVFEDSTGIKLPGMWSHHKNVLMILCCKQMKCIYM